MIFRRVAIAMILVVPPAMSQTAGSPAKLISKEDAVKIALAYKSRRD
jgi:hypothetical protein